MDAREVAGGLSAGMRKVVLATEPGDVRLIDTIGGDVHGQLFRLGIVSHIRAVYLFYDLTPLGLAVRAILASEEGEG